MWCEKWPVQSARLGFHSADLLWGKLNLKNWKRLDFTSSEPLVDQLNVTYRAPQYMFESGNSLQVVTLTPPPEIQTSLLLHLLFPVQHNEAGSSWLLWFQCLDEMRADWPSQRPGLPADCLMTEQDTAALKGEQLASCEPQGRRSLLLACFKTKRRVCRQTNKTGLLAQRTACGKGERRRGQQLTWRMGCDPWVHLKDYDGFCYIRHASGFNGELWSMVGNCWWLFILSGCLYNFLALCQLVKK